MSLIVRLKDASDTKLTVGGRSFHTFTTLAEIYLFIYLLTYSLLTLAMHMCR